MAWSGKLVAAGIVVAALVAPAAEAAEIAISCGAVGQELKLCEEGARAWAKFVKVSRLI